MTNRIKHSIVTIFIAAVWFVNGLWCKVFNLAPRHEQIIASILGDDYSRTFTVAIGLAEVVMAIWILTRFESKFNAIMQITVVAVMNTLEFIIVPELLLWGRLNALFALLFMALIYYKEFVLTRNLNVHIQK